MALAATVLLCGPALATGGHHAVDDAVILEAGTCQVESWLTTADDHQRLLHAGSGCRIGPLELSVAAEHAHLNDSGQSAYQLQAKWATEVLPGFNAGFSLTGNWQRAGSPRYQGTTVAGLVSWFARDDLAWHLNVGRDLLRARADEGRSGLGVDWTVRPGWVVSGERYLETGTHFVRAGLRWAIDEAWTVDASRAHRLHGPGASTWTFGVTWQFSRQ